MKAVITIEYEFVPDAYELVHVTEESAAKLDADYFRISNTMEGVVTFAEWIYAHEIPYTISAEITE